MPSPVVRARLAPSTALARPPAESAAPHRVVPQHRRRREKYQNRAFSPPAASDVLRFHFAGVTRVSSVSRDGVAAQRFAALLRRPHVLDTPVASVLAVFAVVAPAPMARGCSRATSLRYYKLLMSR